MALLEHSPHSNASREHGGLQPRRLASLGLSPNQVLDFSSSTNPYGPPAELAGAISAADLTRYPDPEATLARQALARLCHTDPERVIVGNGAAELLWTLARALTVEHPKPVVLIAEPTFSEFRAASEALAIPTHAWRARPEAGFAVEWEPLERRVRELGANVLYLCTPNTPTGRGVAVAEVAQFAEANPTLSIVLDQSFLSLSDRHSDCNAALPDHVHVVRSLTKDFGIPGLRLGYALTTPRMRARLEALRPAWSVSAGALAAAELVPALQPFVRASRVRLAQDRDLLRAELEKLGLSALPSEAPFLLLAVPGAKGLAQDLLVRHHVLVRHCGSFGLPEFLRISVKPPGLIERLMTALAEELPR